MARREAEVREKRRSGKSQGSNVEIRERRSGRSDCREAEISLRERKLPWKSFTG